MHMAHLVTRLEDQKKVFDVLTERNDISTFPVRGMLQFFMAGKIPTGKLYVDNMSALTAVATIHEMSEYSKMDMDFAAICAMKETAFTKFIQELKVIRQWTSRGFLLNYVRHEYYDKVKEIFSEMNFNDAGAYLNFVAPYEKNAEHQLQILKGKLPNGLTLTPLRPEDVEVISPTWQYPVPHKDNMFKWMIKNFPSSSVRDSNGQPVAWVMTYSCGASAAFFVMPEYRKHGLAVIVGIDAIVQHQHSLPCPRYSGVSADNFRSLELSRKFNWNAADGLSHWMVFTSKEKSKL